VDIFPESVIGFLARVKALVQKGSLADGPANTWTALLEVASCIIL